MRLRGAGAALLLAAALLPAAGRTAEVGAPVSFKADTLAHDRENGLVTARGNVEIRRGGRVLRADEVVYDQPADRLRAQGGVSLRDASGDVIFADRADITGDLKDGVAERIRVRLADESRFSAESARHSDGVRTELRRAVYTPCRPCPEDPERTPSWRLRADKVVRDRTTGEVVYRDATLELWGIPVFHTPYLEQSDPGVGRKTGLLTPTFGHKDDFGLMARLPVFFDIAPDRDATVTPVLTSGEGIFGLFEYRHRFAGGMFSGQGSLARGEAQIGGADARGHFDGRLRLDVDDFWRAGVDASLVSDDTYLGRYDLSSAKTLTSNLFVERFGERGYFAANAYRFQGLRREDRQKTIPLVLPEIEYAYLGAPDRLGGRADIDANFRMLVRETGGNSALLSLDSGWTRPHTAADGQILTAFARLRTDLYWAEGGGRTESGTAAPSRLDGRVFPQLGLDWRYPFVRFGGGYEATITPVAGAVAGPRLGDVVSIADEDGPLPELTDMNVFDRSRASGRDLIEDGQRLYYGAEARLLTAGGAGGTAFFGQSYRIGGNGEPWPEGSGLKNDLSDLVGRLAFDLGARGGISYRVRLDKDDLSVERSELGFDFGLARLRLAGDYLRRAGRQAVERLDDREELTLRLTAGLGGGVRLVGSMRRDLYAGRAVGQEIGLDYRDDCMTARLSFSRDFTRDRDIRPTDSVFLRIGLDTLGSAFGRAALGRGQTGR